VAVRFFSFARLSSGQSPGTAPGLNECQHSLIVDTSPSENAAAPLPVPAAPHLSNPERWVEEHGDYLFKFALVRLRDATKAEDMVQETFLAALKGSDKFAGRSAEKSWLAGILKHKILDHYRKASRETAFADLDFYSEEEGDRFIQDGVFKGGWIHELGPMEWSPDPGATLDSEAFWQTFRDCSNKLPRNVSTVFTMREVDGVESKEICRLLNISENNLWVMLHRARMALRRCLETNWFGKQT
jgi:RNA polymerase sigma-70 factor (TIGR02943 family)